jgi:predicted nucleic acid-binding protein
VFSIVPAEAFTAEMGVVAAKLDAGLKKTGVVVATADLLIGVTALYFSYGVGTRNARHFGRIPGLQVISL